MTTHRTHLIRVWGALLALVIAFMTAGVGVANAASTEPGIDLGVVNGPTTTITADGTPIELIPAASAELPDESTGAAAPSSAIEVQGVSSSTGPTAAAGMDAPISLTWILVGALVILGGAVLLLTRFRRAAQH